MSKKRRGRARQEQLTKRYLEATVRRARDEIIHAVLFATQSPAEGYDATRSISEMPWVSTPLRDAFMRKSVRIERAVLPPVEVG